MLSGCILIGQWLTELHMCSVAACLLYAVCSYMEHHRIYIATLELFCVLTSVQLLTNIFCHLLVFIFWQISHVIWATDFVPDLWQFAAFMNLPYADETAVACQTLFSDLIWILRTFFSDFLRYCVESFGTIFGWWLCFMSPMSATCGSMFV